MICVRNYSKLGMWLYFTQTEDEIKQRECMDAFSARDAILEPSIVKTFER